MNSLGGFALLKWRCIIQAKRGVIIMNDTTWSIIILLVIIFFAYQYFMQKSSKNGEQTDAPDNEEDQKTKGDELDLEIQRRVERAKQLKLDDIIVELYHELQYYPSWMHNPDSKDWVKTIVDDAKEIQLDKKKKKESFHDWEAVEVTINNRPLVFKEKHSLSEFDSKTWYEDIELYVGDKKVFAVSASAEDNPYSLIYEPLSICAFIEGDWIKDIKEIYGRLKKHEKMKEEIKRQEQQNKMKKEFGIE